MMRIVSTEERITPREEKKVVAFATKAVGRGPQAILLENVSSPLSLNPRKAIVVVFDKLDRQEKDDLELKRGFSYLDASVSDVFEDLFQCHKPERTGALVRDVYVATKKDAYGL